MGKPVHAAAAGRRERTNRTTHARARFVREREDERERAEEKLLFS
jgi:hypothetical protein